MGDLNNIMSTAEKSGPRPANINRIANFVAWLKIVVCSTTGVMDRLILGLINVLAPFLLFRGWTAF
jgi:hypothetical protein